MKKFLVGQINTNKSDVTWTLVQRVMEKNNVDILLVQEPPALASQLFEWNNDKCFNALVACPLTLIVAKNTLRVSQCHIRGDRVCAIVVSSKGESIVFLSAYIRFVTGEGLDQLSRALEATQELSPMRFIGFDGNGHSPLWELEFVALDAVGSSIENVLGENDMLVINHRNSPHTFQGAGGKRSWVDISVASPALVSRVHNWSVKIDWEVGSDHLFILTEISGRPERTVVRTSGN